METPELQDFDQPEEAQAPAVDENEGMGGTYMRDSDTGERVLISRTTGCCG